MEASNFFSSPEHGALSDLLYHSPSVGVRASVRRPSVHNFLFSSPEHIVLRVSYCDRSLSGVRPSVNNYLKILLL